MDQKAEVPVKVNVTKSVVLISAVLFTFGMSLIISTFTEWLYFSEYSRYIQFSKVTSYGSIILLIILTILPFIFPSNDFLNFSNLISKRLKGSKKKLIFLLGEIETTVIIYLLLYFINRSIDLELVPIFLFILLILSILIQTPYEKEQKKQKFISKNKINLITFIDGYLNSNKYLSILTGSFYKQIFPSSENIFIFLVALAMPNIYTGIFVIIFLQSFHYIFVYWQIFELSKRGGYFRHYVNILSSLMLAYYAFQIFF